MDHIKYEGKMCYVVLTRIDDMCFEKETKEYNKKEIKYNCGYEKNKITHDLLTYCIITDVAFTRI